ncbi:MAG: phage head closure protein [Rickettsiales bacterium]|jgi:SPP1 family predicted phage head-tail adaptor|nr:phage head closure protein [Rickettsiales bacterium]
MVKYRTNDLNRKVKLQQLTKTSDGAGGFITQWESVKDVWCKIELISNITNRNFGVLETGATHLVVVRRLNNIDKNTRFMYNNSIFNIKHLNDLDNNFTEIICEKIDIEQ